MSDKREIERKIGEKIAEFQRDRVFPYSLEEETDAVFPQRLFDELVAFANAEKFSYEEERLFFAVILADYVEAILRTRTEVGFARALKEADEFFHLRWEGDERPLSATDKFRRVLYAPILCYSKVFTQENLIASFPQDKEYITELDRKIQSASESFKASLRASMNVERLNLPPAEKRAENAQFSISSEGYKVVKDIKKGGQKIVYEVEQNSSGQRMALKEAPLNYSKYERDDKGLVQEALLQAELSHQGVPIICSLEKNDDDKQTPKILEQLVSGEDWSKTLRDNFQDEEKRQKNLGILLRVSRILGYAHRKHDVVHCDVKPANVMVSKFDEVFLIDWGMAVSLSPNEKKTAKGYTPQYAPPERFNNQPVTKAYDVFSLGMILYEIIAGENPRDGLSLDKLALDEAGRQGFNPERPKGAPVELFEIVCKAVSFAPEDRYADAEEFAEALEESFKRMALNSNFNKAVKNFEDLRERFQNVDDTERAASLQESQPSQDGSKSTVSRWARRFADAFRGVKKGQNERAKLSYELAGNVGQFAQIRQEANKFYSGAKKPTPNDFIEKELEARALQLQETLKLNDLGQATALLDYFKKLNDEYKKKLEDENEKKLDDEHENAPTLDFSKQETYLQASTEFTSALQKGLAERNRVHLVKIAAVVMLFLVVALSLHSAKESAKATAKAIESAENAARAEANAKRAEANAKLAKQKTEEANQETLARLAAEKKERKADAVGFANSLAPQIRELETDGLKQVATAMYGGMLEYAFALPDIFTWIKTSRVGAMALEDQSGFSIATDRIVFSKDGKYFATYSNLSQLFFIWDAQKYETVFGERLPLAPNGVSVWLLANPSYSDEKSDDFSKNSPFIAVTAKGFVHYLNLKDGKRFKTVRLQTPDNLISDVSEEPTVEDSDEVIFDDSETINHDANASSSQDFVSLPQLTKSDKKGNYKLYAQTGSRDVLIFKLPSGEFVRNFQGVEEGATPASLSLSEERRYLLIGSKEGDVYQCDLNGANKQKLDLGLKKIEDVSESSGYICSPSPNGKYLAISDASGFKASGIIRVWDVDEKRYIAEIQEEAAENMVALHVERCSWLDNARFVSLCFNDHFCVWDIGNRTKDGAPQRIIMNSDKTPKLCGVKSYAIDPIYGKLLVGDQDLDLRAFNLKNGEMIARASGVTPLLFGVTSCLLPKQNKLLVGGRFIKAVDVNDFNKFNIYYPYDANSANYYGEQYVSGVASSESTSLFAAATTNGNIYFFDDDTPQQTPIAAIESAFKPKNTRSLSWASALEYPMIAMSPDGSRLLETTSSGTEFALWDCADVNNCQKSGSWNKNPEKSKSLSPTCEIFFLDNDELAEVCFDGTIRIWNVETNELLKEVSVEAPLQVLSGVAFRSFPSSVSLSSNKDKIALGFNDGSLKIIDLKSSTVCYSKDAINAIKIGNYKNQSLLSSKSEKSHDKSKSSTDSSPSEKQLLENPDKISGVAWFPNDEMLAVSSPSGQTSLFSVETVNVASEEDDEIAWIEDFDEFHEETKSSTKEFELVSVSKNIELVPGGGIKFDLQAISSTLLSTPGGSSQNRHQTLPFSKNILCFATADGKLLTLDGFGDVKRFNLYANDLGRSFAHPDRHSSPDPQATDKIADNGEIAKLHAPNDGGWRYLITNSNAPGITSKIVSGSNRSWLRTYHSSILTQGRNVLSFFEDGVKIKQLDDVDVIDVQPILLDDRRLVVALDVKGDFTVYGSETGDRDKSTALDSAPKPLKGGFGFFAVAPSRPMIAAGTDKHLYLLDVNQSSPSWTEIDTKELRGRKFSSIVFSADGKQLFIVAQPIDSSFFASSEILIYDLDRRKLLDTSDGFPLYGPMFSVDQKYSRTPNSPAMVPLSGCSILPICDKYLLHIGAGTRFVIYDVESRKNFQELTLPASSAFSSLLSITAAADLTRGEYKNKRPTFVIGSEDGSLRFYQFRKDDKEQDDKKQDDKEQGGFKLVYVLSSLTLETISKRKGYSFESSEHGDVEGLSLSEDGKNLYVASNSGVRAFDMERLWQEIDDAPLSEEETKRKAEELRKEIERLTGLRFVEGEGVEPILSNRMIVLEKSESKPAPSVAP